MYVVPLEELKCIIIMFIIQTRFFLLLQSEEVIIVYVNTKPPKCSDPLT